MEQEIENKIYGIIVVVCFLVVGVLGVVMWMTREGEGDDLQVSFLDIGQGDGIVIAWENMQLLIDGGSNGKVLRERLDNALPYGDRDIEVLLPTHPDADHIGALPNFLSVYDASHIIDTEKESDTGVYRSWNRAREQEGAHRILARAGTRIQFPNGALWEMLLPYDGAEVVDKESNASSVVSMLTYGEHAFLFTGDITTKEEAFIDVEDIDVLKVAHHGSKSSTSATFLERVRPLDAVISVGAENRYGHPDANVLGRLKRSGARILRTDQLGTITYRCNKELCEIHTK